MAPVRETMKIILKNNPKARKSLKQAILAYWAHYGLVLTPDQERLFKELPSPETIQRQRQKLRQSGFKHKLKEVTDDWRDFWVDSKSS